MTDQKDGVPYNRRLNEIDLHVGARIRLRRTTLGLSQDELGERVGLSGNQIEKYESAIHRLGAAEFQKITRALDNTPVDFFFEGVPKTIKRKRDDDGFSDQPLAPYEVDASSFLNKWGNHAFRADSPCHE